MALRIVPGCSGPSFGANKHALTSPPSCAYLAAVDDEEFWQGVQPLRFGPLPNLQESVYVVGYPIGGDTVRLFIFVFCWLDVVGCVVGYPIGSDTVCLL